MLQQTCRSGGRVQQGSSCHLPPSLIGQSVASGYYFLTEFCMMFNRSLLRTSEQAVTFYMIYVGMVIVD